MALPMGESKAPGITLEYILRFKNRTKPLREYGIFFYDSCAIAMGDPKRSRTTIDELERSYATAGPEYWLTKP